jgi:predicted phosphodiesterase
MMRIAILSDIHGNLPALQAVIADLKPLAPDLVIVDGDIVNRGPQSRECVQAIRAQGWPAVYGNHEDYVLSFDEGRALDEWYSDWWLPVRRVSEDLSADELEYLRTLPRHYVVDEPGLPAIRIVHGSPRALNDGLGFWLTDAELCAAVASVPEPVVVGAHTHRPFDQRVTHRWVLNCGAVGAPYNGNPAAQYLVLTACAGTWEADFRGVPYDRAPVYAAWDRSDLMQHVIARVFRYEVETATYHLASYLEFCQAHGLDRDTVASFEQYRRAAWNVTPGRSLRLRAAEQQPDSPSQP